MSYSGEWRMEQPRQQQRSTERRSYGLLTRFGVAALGISVLVIGAWGLRFLYEKLDVPIALIGVDGSIKHLSSSDVEEIVAASLSGGFLSLDLDRIREGLEAHPWVESASARRKWPNELVIMIHEETPIARWGDSGFLNNRGQALDLGTAAELEGLPLLAGPEGMQRRVMQQYRIFTQLLQVTELKIIEFRMGERGGWHLRFEDGPALVVGRSQVTEKIQRFLKVWDKALKVRFDQIDNIDIRYGNGVAVRWKQKSDI